jgi:hypothetical protein
MASKKSTEFVVVACRLPHGIIVPLPGDSEIKLNGLNAIGAHSGHGFTNVSLDTWETIKVVYSGAKWLKSKAVFAFADADSATDAALDRKDVNVGFNPVDPKAPNAPGVGVKIEMSM